VKRQWWGREGAEDLAAGLVGDDEGGVMVRFSRSVSFQTCFLDFEQRWRVGEVGALRIWIWEVMKGSRQSAADSLTASEEEKT